MAATLITLAQAKAHLRITTPNGDPGDPDLQLKLDQAEAVVRNYLKSRDNPEWTPSTVPPNITAAILLFLGRLFEQRGDAEEPDAALWAAVEKLLVGFRDPTLA